MRQVQRLVRFLFHPYLDIGSGCCDNKFTANSMTLLGMELETGIAKAFTDLLSRSARTHQLHKMKD
jgi:hypothetical protein